MLMIQTTPAELHKLGIEVPALRRAVQALPGGRLPDESRPVGRVQMLFSRGQCYAARIPATRFERAISLGPLPISLRAACRLLDTYHLMRCDGRRLVSIRVAVGLVQSIGLNYHDDMINYPHGAHCPVCDTWSLHPTDHEELCPWCLTEHYDDDDCMRYCDRVSPLRALVHVSTEWALDDIARSHR